MGIWTGMLNNKVGNFKFIYVDIILEEEAAPRKINPHRGSKRTKPKTLQELLECVHLQVSQRISQLYLKRSLSVRSGLNVIYRQEEKGRFQQFWCQQSKAKQPRVCLLSEVSGLQNCILPHHVAGLGDSTQRDAGDLSGQPDCIRVPKHRRRVAVDTSGTGLQSDSSAKTENLCS